MKIAVIDNYDSFVYNLVRYLDEIEGVEVSVFRNNHIDYSFLDSSDGILLSPGPGIPENAGDLLNVLEKYHSSKKILGVCLGHQAIGTFFGAELIQNSNPIHGKSSEIVTDNATTIFNDLPRKINVGRYHSWSVSKKLSPSLAATARAMDGEIMAIEHINLPIIGVQFHPESILTPHGRKMISNWINS